MAQHLIKIIGKQKLILFFWHYQKKLLAFRGTNRKTSVKVDDTLALQKSFKIDYLLFILDPTSPVCWLWSWPVCGWGWDLSVQGRSGGGRGQTQLLSGKQMCILWKFLLLCGIQVTNFFLTVFEDDFFNHYHYLWFQ